MISKVSFKPLKGPTVDVPFSDIEERGRERRSDGYSHIHAVLTYIVFRQLLSE